jgi:lipid-binding SYLF domain-containing protein
MNAVGSKLKTMEVIIIMKTKSNVLITALAVLALATGCTTTGKKSSELSTDVKDARADFLNSDDTLAQALANASGYAIFPNVGSGAAFFGAAAGKGELFEKGNPHPLGDVALNQVSVGAQAGGEVYSELILFQDPVALNNFKQSNFQFAARVSAVAAAEGVSANAKYEQGVIILTLPQSGLMTQASIGGQEFDFTPYEQSAKAF